MTTKFYKSVSVLISRCSLYYAHHVLLDLGKHLTPATLHNEKFAAFQKKTVDKPVYLSSLHFENIRRMMLRLNKCCILSEETISINQEDPSLITQWFCWHILSFHQHVPPQVSPATLLWVSHYQWIKKFRAVESFHTMQLQRFGQNWWQTQPSDQAWRRKYRPHSYPGRPENSGSSVRNALHQPFLHEKINKTQDFCKNSWCFSSSI